MARRQPSPETVATRMGLVTRTRIAGPVTLLIAGGDARVSGEALVPLEGGFAFTVPVHHEMVTVLPGEDALETLREAVRDALVIATDVEDEDYDEQRARSYQELLHCLESPLPHLG